MGQRLRVALVGAFGLSTLACSDAADKLLGCVDETPAEPAFVTTEAPSWEGEVEPTEARPFLGLTSGRLQVQVWDCVDMSWVADVPAQKVVQVFVDDTDCYYAESVLMETAPCDDSATDDIFYRDMDGDGASAFEGDPDDRDPSVVAGGDDSADDTGVDSGALAG